MTHKDKKAEFLRRIAETAEHGGWKRLSIDLQVPERTLRNWRDNELKGGGNGDTPREVERLRKEVERLREIAHAAGRALTPSQHLDLALDLMGPEIPESELSPEEKARRRRYDEELKREVEQEFERDMVELGDHFLRLSDAYRQLGLAFKARDEPARVHAWELVRSIEAQYPDPGISLPEHDDHTVN